MDFLNPWLLFGTLGVAVPIAIHLLNRFRFRQVDWAAMELLRRAIIVRSRRIRLEDLILLLLRCAAVLLLALALARPTVAPPDSSGGGDDVAAVIAVDASFSMAHRPTVHSRHDRAVERVREVLRVFSPGSPVSVVQMGHGPRILLRSVGYEAERFDRLLEETSPLPERLQLEACLEELVALVDELKAPDRECYLVTDAQASTWEEFSDKARALLEQLTARARVFCIPVGSTGDDNVAVTGFEFASGSPRSGGLGRFLASVKNTGTRPREQVPVSLFVDDAAVDRKVLDRLEAGETVDVPLFARFGAPGSVRLRAVVGEDPLTTDNSRHLVVEVRERLQVVCADGSPSRDPRGSEADFVAIALSAGDDGAEQPGVQVITLPWLDLPSQPLTGVDVLFLANIPDVHPEEATRIFNFVRNGGGLFVFLGQASQPELLNEHFRQGTRPVLPGEIGELRETGSPAQEPGDPAGVWMPEAGPGAGRNGPGVGIRVSSPEHPLGRVVESLRPELVNEARFRRCFPVRLGEEARSIWELGATGLPLLSERELGGGRVLLFASSADRAWSNVVTHPLYPILVREAVTYLTRRDTEVPTALGDGLRVVLPGSSEGGRWQLTDPRGEETAVPTIRRGADVLVEVDRTELPGFYRLEGPDESSTAIHLAVIHLAVNVDTAESAVRALAPRELQSAFGSLPVRVVSEEDDLQAAIRESRIGRELWWELLVAALLLLLVESLLARWFSRRMTSVTPGGTR